MQDAMSDLSAKAINLGEKMNEREIIERLDKLQYQVETLGQTIDYEKHPVEALILIKDWGPTQLEKAHDIFEFWDKK